MGRLLDRIERQAQAKANAKALAEAKTAMLKAKNEHELAQSARTTAQAALLECTTDKDAAAAFKVYREARERARLTGVALVEAKRAHEEAQQIANAYI